MSTDSDADMVLAFWREAGPAKWYAKDERFDRAIENRFAKLHERCAAGGCGDWVDSADGALAAIIVLDQFSRNMIRGSPRAFAQDPLALNITLRALEQGFDKAYEPLLRQFFYMPLMHSESLPDQELCVRLCHSLPLPGTLPYARDHEQIIRRFGRFPHRNAVLGRHTTPAERAFLEGGGFSG